MKNLLDVIYGWPMWHAKRAVPPEQQVQQKWTDGRMDIRWGQKSRRVEEMHQKPGGRVQLPSVFGHSCSENVLGWWKGAKKEYPSLLILICITQIVATVLTHTLHELKP